MKRSDILAPGLEVVFCGLNPATSAEASGHNFSHRSNRFWSVLHLAGFTDVRLEAKDERRLLEYGCGITAAVTRATRSANEVGSHEFRQARRALERKITRFHPAVVAFLGKQALATMMGNSQIAWGQQPDRFGGAVAWVLPNPSGLNRAFTLASLTEAYRRLRLALPVRGGIDLR